MSKKITSVLLMGGLGNQLFQYAFAKAWSLKHKGTYQLNTSYLEDDTFKDSFTKRNYELGIFRIEAIATPKSLVWGFDPKNRYIRFLLKKLEGKFIAREKNMRYEHELIEAADKKMFIGYFQSEKYFADFRSEILRDLVFSADLSDQTKDLAKIIGSTDSVSLHVRRGDYVTIKANMSHIGVCSLDYYRLAIDKIKSRIQDPTFFVFSDDIVWARENINVDPSRIIFVDHNVGNRSYEDMYLMSQCQHNIIANSSFSWWGAWLNQNPNKIVMAPKRWFANPEMDSTDIIPESWISL